MAIKKLSAVEPMSDTRFDSLCAAAEYVNHAEVVTECLIEIGRLRLPAREGQKIAELANDQLGWNGVENSKILSTFIEEYVADLRRDLAEAKVDLSNANNEINWLRTAKGWCDSHIKYLVVEPTLDVYKCNACLAEELETTRKSREQLAKALEHVGKLHHEDCIYQGSGRDHAGCGDFKNCTVGTCRKINALLTEAALAAAQKGTE